MGSAQIHADLAGAPQITAWQMDHPDFGGMSALIMNSTGTALVAGGDHGALVEASVARGSTGEITGINSADLSKVLLRSGRTPTAFKMDLEALTRDPQGGWFVGYEGFVRIERLAHAQALPVATHSWEKFVELFGNQAFEALATLPDGRVIAIPEVGPVADSMIWEDKRWRNGPNIPARAGYLITGADVGPDGCLYLVERR